MRLDLEHALWRTIDYLYLQVRLRRAKLHFLHLNGWRAHIQPSHHQLQINFSPEPNQKNDLTNLLYNQILFVDFWLVNIVWRFLKSFFGQKNFLQKNCELKFSLQTKKFESSSSPSSNNSILEDGKYSNIDDIWKIYDSYAYSQLLPKT